jgi:hypothetical protein
MDRMRAFFVASLGVVLAGCASSVQTPAPGPADVASL